jgi:hypothetical protein
MIPSIAALESPAPLDYASATSKVTHRQALRPVGTCNPPHLVKRALRTGAHPETDVDVTIIRACRLSDPANMLVPVLRLCQPDPGCRMIV